MDHEVIFYISLCLQILTGEVDVESGEFPVDRDHALELNLRAALDKITSVNK